MTCLEFTDLAIRRMVAAGFEVVPVAVGDRMMFRTVHRERGDLCCDARADEMSAWLDALAYCAGVAS
jgi:hypothetical protein